MAQATIAAREGALDTGAKAVETAYDKIIQSTQHVQEDLGELSGLWSGESSVAYRELIIRWTTDASALAGVLTTLQGALRSTQADLSKTEQEQKSALGVLTSMMTGGL